MKKIFTFVAAMALVASAAQAQSFAKFEATDSNGLKSLSELAQRPGAGQLDVIVPENFDLTNVTVDCGTTIIDGTMPTNFSTPQKVTVKGTTTEGAETSREFTITFKKTKPATLTEEAPFEMALTAENPVTTWTESTIGWTPAAIDTSKPEQVSMGNVGACLVTAIANEPSKVEYNLWAGVNTTFSGKFTVDASTDGITWTTLKLYVNEEMGNNDGKKTVYSHELASGIRFIRWTYTERNGQRVNVNNIKIYKGQGNNISNNTAAEASAFVANGELNINNATEVAKVEVINVAGQNALTEVRPANTISLNALANGVYLVRLTTVDGNVSTSKVVVK